MKITEKFWNDEDAGYGSSSIEIELETNEGEASVRFAGGEPEDFCLVRDLHDAYNISDLLKMAYNAGRNNESFEKFVVNENEESD